MSQPPRLRRVRTAEVVDPDAGVDEDHFVSPVAEAILPELVQVALPSDGAPQLAQLLLGHDRDESPFDDEVPKVDAAGTHWVEPFLVVDVDSHATAKNQRLRQPSYRGVRTDLSPEDLLT